VSGERGERSCRHFAMMRKFHRGMTDGLSHLLCSDCVCLHRLLRQDSTHAAVRSGRRHSAHCVRADFHLPLRLPSANRNESGDRAWLLRGNRAFAVRLDRSHCLQLALSGVAKIIATTSLASAALQTTKEADCSPAPLSAEHERRRLRDAIKRLRAFAAPNCSRVLNRLSIANPARLSRPPLSSSRAAARMVSSRTRSAADIPARSAIRVIFPVGLLRLWSAFRTARHRCLVTCLPLLCNSGTHTHNGL
jgi:hypothetical protein